jgi:trehalose 6-phosphate synthase/phosphatase
MKIAPTSGAVTHRCFPVDKPRAGRVLIVSNRLPVTVDLDGARVGLRPSNGGLATGLRRYHEGSSSTWIGWSGLSTEASGGMQREIQACLADVDAVGVSLREVEVAGFYRRFANSVLWPLLHNEPLWEQAEATDWAVYQAVNTRFADAISRVLQPGDRVWIHDYHLMLVPRLLRARHPDVRNVRIGFFLHTPFPEVRGLASLPQGVALLDGVLGADAIGLHTRAYAERLAEAVRTILGRRVALAAGTGTADDAGRAVLVHANPMGIDVTAFTARAADPRVPPRVAALRAAGCPLFVGVDRLDPTKGIPQRLEAFGRLLELRPHLRGRARLLQLAVPSRTDVPVYRSLRARVEEIVRCLNARFGIAGWTPIEYVYDSVDDIELAALYRAADVMLVTPLCDGMNLVAKEFVASRTDQDGVLVLSEHAGAAAELRSALLVDPGDVDQLARAYAAALDMSPAERRVRMRRLQTCVRAHDVRRWADACLHYLDAAPTAVRRVVSG